MSVEFNADKDHATSVKRLTHLSPAMGLTGPKMVDDSKGEHTEISECSDAMNDAFNRGVEHGSERVKYAEKEHEKAIAKLKEAHEKELRSLRDQKDRELSQLSAKLDKCQDRGGGGGREDVQALKIENASLKTECEGLKSNNGLLARMMEMLVAGIGSRK